jgi:hypothetical protein
MPSHQGYQIVATEPSNQSQTLDMESGKKMPSTSSSQQLVANDSESMSASLDDQDSPNPTRTSSDDDIQTRTSISLTDWFTVGVLCFVNLINYMDRFTIAGK